MKETQPLYAYIKRELLNRIQSNNYKIDEKIPTELELCEEFNVSRTTVRAALNQLTTEGILTKKQGKGTFVADRKLEQVLSNTVYSYSDQVQAQGKKAEITLISLSVIAADEELKGALDLELNEPVQRIERVRKANDELTQYEIAYLPWKLAPGITKEQAETSIYESLKQLFAVQVGQTIEKVEIVLADENISFYLQCKEDLPCFYLETVAKDTLNNKIEYSKSYFRGDKTNFIIERKYY